MLDCTLCDAFVQGSERGVREVHGQAQGDQHTQSRDGAPRAIHPFDMSTCALSTKRTG